MAHLLTAARLLLALPVAVAFAWPTLLDPGVHLALLAVAIATDHYDGKVARHTGTASPRGQLFDHATDCLFVTAGLTGAALAGHMTLVLPALVIVAFSQYVVDSYWLHQQKQLRMSTLGRWNGVLYFVPLVLITVSRLGLWAGFSRMLAQAAAAMGYALAISTIASIIDRATASRRLAKG